MNEPGEVPSEVAATRKRGGVVIPPSLSERIASVFSRFGILFVLLALAIAFGVTAPRFLLPANIANIFKQVSVVAVMAIGMMMVILIGGIDLSVGSVALLSATVCVWLINHQVMSVAPAIVAGLAAGCLVGLLNGLLAEKVKISPIIVTLGTMMAVRGLAQAILWIDNSWLWVKAPLFLYISKNTIGPVPVAAAITLVLYVIFGVILQQTRYGRHLYAIGGNQRTAHLCGIPVDRTKITAYVLCGLTAGIGGLILVARLSAISPKVGDRLEFDIITAVVLGGASLTGGSGRLEKTLLGAIMVGMIMNYMTIKGIPGNYQAFVSGMLILIAAILDRLSKART
jgi:ribose transport system permease protein